MAKGWESKSIEQQIEQAGTESGLAGEKLNSPADAESRRKREGLLLQRSRILQDMETARSPRYRKLLEEMLSHIEQQLS